MCQYSAVDGVPNDWHLVHLGARAVGGFGLVIAEATAVGSEGRITPQDCGLWNDEQADAWRRITDIVHARGALAGVQLQHAGRKASTYRPFHEATGSVPPGDGGWTTVAPSAVAFPGLAEPAALSDDEVAAIPRAFAAAARRALDAGFDTVELHAAHGYLLHQFLSPLSNRRTDEYGGSLENRMRFPLDVIRAVRAALPAQFPLGVRVSATAGVDDGLTVDESVTYALRYAELGLDYVCVSSGGLLPKAPIPVGPGYQVGLAKALSRALKEKVFPIAVRAVGMITDPVQAESILAAGDADWVALARGMLDNPHWAWHAAKRLGVEIAYPRQYERASPRLWR
jgi:2,4-dienoyl-CoA reductase-like NADH-dependent reductase (Old Yellow Enzyme family)